MEISFSYNWNGKLNNNAFTTIRYKNNNKYKVGAEYSIKLKGADLGIAKIVDIKCFRLSQLNNFMAYLDTGYSKEHTTNIIRKMYKTDSDIELMFILLVKI